MGGSSNRPIVDRRGVEREEIDNFEMDGKMESKTLLTGKPAFWW